MQTLAFLWFELEVAQNHLHATFAESQLPAKARNLCFMKALVLFLQNFLEKRGTC